MKDSPSFLSNLERQPWLLAILLGSLVASGFLPALYHTFINMDDEVYILSNPHVLSGLKVENIRWAFTTGYAGNWHPITWISHMVDCSLYGTEAWGHHLTSILIHAVNSALVFLVLRAATGSLWRSLLVGMLWGLHPTRLESVVWAAERKDVLCVLFGLLSMAFYLRWIRLPGMVSSIRWKSFSLGFSLFFYVMSLMSKPMLVTLPFLLLLIDSWPLNRLSLFSMRKRVLVEKIPFLVLAFLAGLITLRMQGMAGAMDPLMSRLGIVDRIANAEVSVIRYLVHFVWPMNLSIFYPHPGHWPMAWVATSTLLIIMLTGVALIGIRHVPWIFSSWMWFLIGLLPTLGLVQVGTQSMADRYSYLPSIGLCILVIWGSHAVIRIWERKVEIATVGALAMLAVSLLITDHQLVYWRDSESIFRRAIAVTPNNILAHINLGNALVARGDLKSGLEKFQQALLLDPQEGQIHINIASTLMYLHQENEALNYFQSGTDLMPNDAKGHFLYGSALLQLGKNTDAIHQMQEAIRINPDHLDARNHLGSLLRREGKLHEAADQYHYIIAKRPDLADAWNNLGITLVQAGRYADAEWYFKEAIRHGPGNPDRYNNLGMLYLSMGRKSDARDLFTAALKIQPGHAGARSNLQSMDARKSPNS